MKKNKALNSVYVYTSGAVMVFDHKGQQLAKLQKPITDKSNAGKIYDMSDDFTDFFIAEWGGLAMKIERQTFKLFFTMKR